MEPQGRKVRGKDRGQALALWRADLKAWLDNTRRQVRQGGRVAIVIGDGHAGSRPLDSLAAIESAAGGAGLRLIARASGARPDAGPNVLRREHVVLLEIP